MKLAVLGDPLAYTRSPDLHRAGLRALGLEGESHALRTPVAELGGRLRSLVAEGFHGVNLTHPLKEPALDHLTAVAPDAARARSVNTVSLAPGMLRGESTDGPGFLDFVRALGRDPSRERVVLLGAGGAARSLALALVGAGAEVTASARDPRRVEGAWVVLGATLAGWRSAAETRALAAATLVVNATPLGGADGPLAVGLLPAGALVVDLVYGPELTPWVTAARGAGHEAHDGLGLLVHQARRSLAIWCGSAPPLEPLARAVGWPR